MNILTIGTSMITGRFIEAMKQVEGVNHVGVYSRSIEKALNFAPGVKAYNDLAEALADPQIDAVYVASPNSLHYPQTKQALLANKHVICEKPFVSTLEQLDELIQLAQERDLILFEAITTVHLPNFRIVEETVKKIGPVKIVNCNFSQYSSKYGQYQNHQQVNIFDPAFDGGALKDINVYNIHFVTKLFGEPKSFQYYANRGYNGIDTSGILILEYPDFKAVCIGSKDSSSDSYGLIQGEKGTIRVSSTLGRCTSVSLHSHLMDNHQAQEPEVISIEQEFHMTYELEVFRDLVNTHNFSLRDHHLEHSRLVVSILEQAAKQDAK